MDKESEQRQIVSLHKLKESRNEKRLQASLEKLSSDARAGVNIVPAVVVAVKEYATVGEITNVLRDVYGKWQTTSSF